jgi:hypothetical protein
MTDTLVKMAGDLEQDAGGNNKRNQLKRMFGNTMFFAWTSWSADRGCGGYKIVARYRSPRRKRYKRKNSKLPAEAGLEGVPVTSTWADVRIKGNMVMLRRTARSMRRVLVNFSKVNHLGRGMQQI